METYKVYDKDGNLYVNESLTHNGRPYRTSENGTITSISASFLDRILKQEQQKRSTITTNDI